MQRVVLILFCKGCYKCLVFSCAREQRNFNIFISSALHNATVYRGREVRCATRSTVFVFQSFNKGIVHKHSPCQDCWFALQKKLRGVGAQPAAQSRGERRQDAAWRVRSRRDGKLDLCFVGKLPEWGRNCRSLGGWAGPASSRGSELCFIRCFSTWLTLFLCFCGFFL